MSFTCISCHVAFKEANVQREHYKTDWHRYNLKRKVADLPPVTAEVFQQRVLEQRAQVSKQEALKGVTPYCQYCKKKFGSEKSYENHLLSRKHQENVLIGPSNKNTPAPKAAGDKEKTEEILQSSENEDEEMEDDSDEWEDVEEAIPPSTCIFCNKESDTMESSLEHMSSHHSFFIPDIDYVVDVEGLVSYLGERVGQGHLCCWCGHLGRQFPTTEAVQKHMLDKGHCKMYHEGEVLLEYSDFYDYSSSYPDGGNPDDVVELNVIADSDSDFELTLPSGATIGHRSLSRYYRQKLNPNPRPAPSRMAVQYGNHFKALGWTSSTREIVERKAKDMTFMRKLVLKHQLGVSVKANKLQKHFRRQVDF